jgi:hypothetical protein
MAETTLWANYFDVVILPPPPVRDHAIALSRKLQKYGARFVLGRRRYIPHISLYHIPVLPHDFEAFAATVERVAGTHRGGDLRLREIEMPIVMTDKPAWLKKLHLDVVHATSKYFDWKYGAEDLWSVDYLPSNLKVRAEGYLKKYGSPMIDAVFRPHITLTSFEDKSVAKDIPPLEFEPLVFHVDQVSICELGPSHSCQRIAGTYLLK